MGIQRLSQDLLPYAEGVVLGTPNGPPDANTIQNLVIDGPSLVYFVFNKLLSSHKSVVLPPTYAEINQGVHHILDDIQSHGVCIQHIFFDGGLPKSKREIRLGRMEKVRQQLEVFRKVHPGYPPTEPSSAEVRDFEKVLWANAAMSTRSFALSAPPFMVASTVENLRTSTNVWKDRVHVVAGEADLYCALAARDSAECIAILTNDMDLAVHDLGPNGRVTLLHSLEKRRPKSSAEGLPSLVALSINPTSVAARLNVSSLLAFGFERSLDSTVTTTVIRQRTVDTSRRDHFKTEYTTFLEEFSPSSIRAADTKLHLDDIDPRTAELLFSLKDTPHVYLTPVLEDPQRDSSWSYGAGIRQLAYSILVSSVIPRKEKDGNFTTVVTEYARRGQRIVPTTVPSLKQADIVAQAVELEELLPLYLGESTDHGAWYTLALHLVRQEKVRQQRMQPSLDEVMRLFSLLQTADYVPASAAISWDDIHILANMHAVLYSLRMLHQITGHVLEHQRLRLEQPKDSATVPGSGSESNSSEGLSGITKSLHMMLARMPPIASLFLDIPHLRREISDTSFETRNSMILSLKHALGHAMQSGSAPDRPVVDEDGRGNTNIELRNTERSSTKRKKRRKGERHTVEVVNPARSRNIFMLLSDESG